jgi:hypothetical protein
VVRSAGAADLERVAALLAARGEPLSHGSLEARFADEDGGTLLDESAMLSWALDGGALHLYDFAGDPAAFAALLQAADAIGRSRFAAVLTATLDEADPYLPVLRAAGFVDDWEEPDVRDGVPRQLVGLAREIG